MSKGWIVLSRQIQDHWLWKDEPFSKGQAWIDLLMLANFEDKNHLHRGELVVCKRGDVNLSIQFLATRWGWSRHKVSNFLNLLERDTMIKQKRTPYRTVITIEKYDEFQSVPETRDTKRTPDGTSKGHQKDITNNDNNVKQFNNKRNQFNGFQKQNYDFEELERILEKK